jgi:HSP20 family protein
MDEKNIEVKIANGVLMIKGEKRRRRRKGSGIIMFARAVFVHSSAHSPCPMALLTVTLPKTAEAQKAEKKITVRTE